MVKLLPLEVLQCLGITGNKSQTPCHGLNPGSSHNMHPQSLGSSHSAFSGLKSLSLFLYLKCSSLKFYLPYSFLSLNCQISIHFVFY